MIKKIAVLTSGGDAPGMNNAVRAVVKHAQARGIEPFLVIEGYKGLVENNIVPASETNVDKEYRNGGTFIYSARLPEFADIKVREIAVKNLKDRGIEAVIVIGGDGSYMGAKKLTEMGINCIGIPGTIDNDISSSETTIGFDTALNTVVESVDRIRDTMRSHNRVAIVEVMGRHCPDLTVFGGIAARAEAVVTSENIFSTQDFVDVVKKTQEIGKRSVIIMVAELTYGIDGRPSLDEIAKEVEKQTGKVTRVSVLAHQQRGGTPTAMERVWATRMGVHAVELLTNGIGGRVVGNKGDEITDFEIMESFNMPRKSRKDLIDMTNKMNIIK
ncbi:6-phosphofructokinase [Mycoplasma todarodis]|uniref:ATP-dependent 6-phosphofructokinase n=1 Tax=Mycoplasma todarodis TaxID=1937191 RepID=A0A4R0XIR7_9MOLU|nr:6-phosphofructokinase [Mycoplasma todarodis]TCG10486.1 6-phosphofructokinase [Mycoplasma todarodis]